GAGDGHAERLRHALPAAAADERARGHSTRAPRDRARCPRRPRRAAARPRTVGDRAARPGAARRTSRSRGPPGHNRAGSRVTGAAVVSAIPELTLDDVGRISTRILDEVERAVVGKRDALELVLLGLLADGHILLEDFPGLAKTLIARSFAQVASME